MANAITADTMPGGSQIRTASGLNVILGVWLVISAFIFAATSAGFWNNILVGMLVLILASTRVSRPTASTKPLGWTNAVIGIWLIIAPFVLDYASLAATWNDIGVGVLLLIFASWSASLPRTLMTTRTTATDAAANRPLGADPSLRTDRPVTDQPRPPRDRM
ncbi:MAG TPA: SPW repeat protein [Gammaproteobacteria bacterium]|nr:SPW repeat protein [Gammaproteobacteria bacterium]